MPRFTEAYSNFMGRLLEIETIQKMAKKVANEPTTQQNNAKINSLCRSGVVLLSSHIEGYIEELGEIALDQIHKRTILKTNLGNSFKYYLSRDLIDDIKKLEDPVNVVNRLQYLITRDDHIWNANPRYSNPLPSNGLIGDFSNPKHERIAKFFRRFGYTNFEGDLANHLQSNYPICINMVDSVISQRNRIAHGELFPVGTPKDLSDMIRIIKLYCRETDCVVGDWFKQIGCIIRN